MDSNDQLRNLYLSKWENLCKAMKPIIEDDSFEVKPTNPLLLWTKGDTEYETADIRVMIFGQETNDWMGVFNPNTNQDEEIEKILDVYDSFYNFGGYESHGGQFWNAFRLFMKMLNDKYPDKRIAYAWDNIVKIGKANCKNCPPDYIYNIEQKEFSVVKDEIEILKPQIILFLTGPDYDKRIEDKIGVLPFTSFSSYNERELAKVAVPNVHFAYRTYHPNYIYRQGKGQIESYFETVINDIDL